MVEFEGIAERLYAVVRQASKGNRQTDPRWTSPAAPLKWTVACWTA